VLGCMRQTATICPPELPFSFLDFSGTSNATAPPTTAIVNRCAPAGELTSCPAFAADATGMPITYSKPAFNRSTLTGCIRFYTAPGAYNGNAPKCPVMFPMVAITRNDPLIVADQYQVAGCYTAGSTCAADVAVTAPIDTAPLNFTLIPGGGLPIYCAVRVTGIATCAVYPGGVYTPGLPMFSPDGTTWMGCAASTIACPQEFPIYFQTADAPPVIMKCQASIAANSSCSAASNASNPVAIRNSNNTVLGCSGPALECTQGRLFLANSPDGPAVRCSNNFFNCTDPGFPFPLYDGATSSGGRVVRCLPPQAAANCDAAFFGNYTVEVTGCGCTGFHVWSEIT
jgi:hypothetical protein